MFTSTLSVNEFALLSEAGPEPIAQVLGSAVFKVGWQYLPPEAQWGGNDLLWQLETVTDAWNHARRLAFDRLREEARSVGGHAVVGVSLRRGDHGYARRSVDFVVSGTAIRLPGAEDLGEAAPMLSDLSVQDYRKLIGRGWSPAGLVAATSVFFISQAAKTSWHRRISVMRNQELREFSDGFSAARHYVVGELRSQARSAKAEIGRGKFVVRSVGRKASGIAPSSIALGGDISLGGADKRAGVVIAVHAMGTAIRRGPTATAPTPSTMLKLGGTR